MKKILVAISSIAALSSFHVAHAGPAGYVLTPEVEYGEKEIDFKAGSLKADDAPRFNAASVGFGYGATQNWFTELYVKYNRESGGATEFDAWEWENKFKLTETGQYPVDIGFVAELERPQDRDEGYEVAFGPLFQSELGKVQLNANFLLERHYRAASAGPMEMNYQWQAKYRWKPQFEFGLQGFGELGKWNDWASRNDQSHRFGPAIFGKFDLGNRRAVRYNAAYLTDISDAVHNDTLRLQVEYEF